jgi:hypothetical protein
LIVVLGCGAGWGLFVPTRVVVAGAGEVAPALDGGDRDGGIGALGGAPELASGIPAEVEGASGCGAAEVDGAAAAAVLSVRGGAAASGPGLVHARNNHAAPPVNAHTTAIAPAAWRLAATIAARP